MRSKYTSSSNRLYIMTATPNSYMKFWVEVIIYDLFEVICHIFPTSFMKQFDLAKRIDTLYQIAMGKAMMAIIFCTMTSYILTSNVWNLDVFSVLSLCRRKQEGNSLSDLRQMSIWWYMVRYGHPMFSGHIRSGMVIPSPSGHIWSGVVTQGPSGHMWSIVVTPGPSGLMWSGVVTPGPSGHMWSGLVTQCPSGHMSHSESYES